MDVDAQYSVYVASWVNKFLRHLVLCDTVTEINLPLERTHRESRNTSQYDVFHIDLYGLLYSGNVRGKVWSGHEIKWRQQK